MAAMAASVWLPAASVCLAQAKRVDVVVTARAASWVKVEVDGGTPYQTIMRPGQTLTFHGRRVIRLSTGNAGGVSVIWNGRRIPALGHSGQPTFRRFPAVPLPVIKPKPKPAPQPAVVKPLPPTVEKPVPPRPAPARPVTEAQEPVSHIITYLSLGLLLLLLIVCIWMLFTLQRESRLLADLGLLSTGEDQSISIVTSHRLSRGKSVHLVETGGRLFLVGTGGVTLIGEMAHGASAPGVRRAVS